MGILSSMGMLRQSVIYMYVCGFSDIQDRHFGFLRMNTNLHGYPFGKLFDKVIDFGFR
jgi:hypothetical protein